MTRNWWAWGGRAREAGPTDLGVARDGGEVEWARVAEGAGRLVRARGQRDRLHKPKWALLLLLLQLLRGKGEGERRLLRPVDVVAEVAAVRVGGDVVIHLPCEN